MSEKIIKYPRTFHLTFSPGCTNDDKMLSTDEYFIGKEIVITSKLDGSNFCMTNQECFARSHNGPPTHKSFDLAKSIHSQVKTFIPKNYHIYSEYLFAKHSIHYKHLPHYLAIFNIYDIDEEKWLSWTDVEKYCNSISIPTVPVLFNGIIENHKDFKSLIVSFMKENEFINDEREGVVVRLAKSFNKNDFKSAIAKYVRRNHVQTSEHWKDQEIVKNGLIK